MKQLRLLTPIATVLLLAILCELALTLGNVSKFILPKPTSILKALYTEWPWILMHLKVSMMEAVLGFGLGIALGTILALSYLFLPALESLIVPLAVGVINVPFVAIAPVLFIVLGYGPLPKILIVMVVCFFPIMSNFSAGLHSVNQNLLKRFYVLKATKWHLFTKLQLPTSIPFLATGLQIAVSNAVIAAIVGELLGTTQGLGFVILMSISQYRLGVLMATVAVTTVASIILTTGVRAFTRIIFKKWLVN